MKNKHNKEEENLQNKSAANETEQPLAEEVKQDESHKTAAKDKKSKSKHDKDELQQKYDELNDKYLRLYSDFDNYRKRTMKERLDLQKNATQDLIVELLGVLDDFERAMKAFEQHKVYGETAKGVELIYSKLKKILEQKGLEPMNSMGKEFDTDFHEAITNIPAPSEDLKGKVVDVIQKGYLLNGKIIRFAKVVVGS